MTSSRLAPFGTTVFAEISALARAKGAIDLGQGRPDFDGPDFVKDAAAEAIRSKPNQYAPMPGVPELRQALSGRWRADTGTQADPDTEITVTSGCTEALAACCLGLLEPGDRVVVFEPFYDAYLPDLAMAGAEPVFVPLRAGAGGFAFDENELARACEGARALILNTPHNPTGKVFSREELGVIARLAQRHGLLVISDEVYDRLVFDGHEHLSIAAFEGMRERTVTLGSFGKAFTMTGWKIGWAIAPAGLSAGVRAAHQFLTFAVPTPLQHAAAVALGASDELLSEIARTFERKRDRLAEGLRGAGLAFVDPGGGYFILAPHGPWSGPRGLGDDLATCRWLIDEVGVATIPPSAFYRESDEGKGLLRFGFCKCDETIDAAVERLSRILS